MSAPRRLERVRFVDGGLLAARDLGAAADYESRMQEMHVRLLHGTFGVALGYEVLIGRAGAVLFVGPGVAYDGRGRELLSPRTVALRTPRAPRGHGDGPWWFDLLIAHGAGDASVGTCGCAGRTDSPCPGHVRPVWRWAFAGAVGAAGGAPPLADDVRRGEEIPVVRVAVSGAARFASLDASRRPLAAPLSRPRVAYGRLAAGDAPVTGSADSWSVVVDTRSGSFTRVPYYFVSLAAHPFSDSSTIELPEEPGAAWFTTNVLGPFVSVRSAGPSFVEVEVRMAVFEERARPALGMASLGATLPVAIDWVGIEPPHAVPPFDVPEPESELPPTITRIGYTGLRGIAAPEP